MLRNQAGSVAGQLFDAQESALRETQEAVRLAKESKRLEGVLPNVRDELLGGLKSLRENGSLSAIQEIVNENRAHLIGGASGAAPSAIPGLAKLPDWRDLESVSLDQMSGKFSRYFSKILNDSPALSSVFRENPHLAKPFQKGGGFDKYIKSKIEESYDVTSQKDIRKVLTLFNSYFTAVAELPSDEEKRDAIANLAACSDYKQCKGGLVTQIGLLLSPMLADSDPLGLKPSLLLGVNDAIQNQIKIFDLFVLFWLYFLFW